MDGMGELLEPSCAVLCMYGRVRLHSSRREGGRLTARSTHAGICGWDRVVDGWMDRMGSDTARYCRERYGMVLRRYSNIHKLSLRCANSYRLIGTGLNAHYFWQLTS